MSARIKRHHKRRWIGLGCLLIGVGWLTTLFAQPQTPPFHSFLTKDLTRLVPATSFSKNDQIYLHTVWTDLTGNHEIKVLWVRPDKTVQETSRIKVMIPPKTSSYTTWAWLSFKKGLLDFLPMDAKFIGSWKARLFLDGNLLKEYPFSVL
ncbi:MAG: hypothetical protein V2B13_04610 [Pseudomonadota bacterium]